MSVNELSPQQKVIANIQTSVTFMLGKGARATMREAGKAASRDLWPELPSGVSFGEAAHIMHEGVKSLDGFGEFNLRRQREDGVYEIEFKNCAFAQFTTSSGQPCGEQAICFFGFGLVEETMRRLMGKRVQVQLIERDENDCVCRETATPR